MKDFSLNKSSQTPEKPKAEKTSVMPGFLYLVKSLSVVFTILLIGYALLNIPEYLQRPLNKEKITISGSAVLTREEILEVLDLGPNPSWWHLDSFELGVKLIKHPWVENASIRKRIDLGIDVNIKEITPLSYLKLKDDLFLLGSDYRVLSVAPSKGKWHLPVIVNNNTIEYQIGDYLPKEMFRKAFTLMDLLKKNNTIPLATVSEIDISDPFNIQLITIPHGIVVKMGHDNFFQKLNQLKDGLFVLDKERLNMRYIDLRYENAIVFRRKR